MKQQTG